MTPPPTRLSFHTRLTGSVGQPVSMRPGQKPAIDVPVPHQSGIIAPVPAPRSAIEPCGAVSGADEPEQHFVGRRLCPGHRWRDSTRHSSWWSGMRPAAGDWCCSPPARRVQWRQAQHRSNGVHGAWRTAGPVAEQSTWHCSQLLCSSAGKPARRTMSSGVRPARTSSASSARCPWPPTASPTLRRQ